MKKRNDVKVVIGGKQYNMGGYESEEYLQSIASYINAKMNQLKNNGGVPKLDSDIANILLQINIADDYFNGFAADLTKGFHIPHRADASKNRKEDKWP